MTTKFIDMKNFSLTPYGRYPIDGTDNGETFRKQFLEPAFRDPEVEKVIVNLDSVQEGYEYGSSFLEESFGGLVRSSGIAADIVLNKLEIRTAFEDYIQEINEYIKRAAA
ncbi:STAS-like domain-containing protein [Stutzerimonas degradans]|uniref:STAS-like domain-containing protein n=1 Tax=Stutzerimonas degradans TaxID=2968968 RepID=UPI0013F4EA6E|nr:DUF4325 domain-containing protein [Stutzerimonas degradans]NHC09799.1 STAS-like domain-containing protein [Stutzerimonas degradans]